MSVTITMPKVDHDKLLAEQERLLKENRKLSSNKCVRLVTAYRVPYNRWGWSVPEYTTVKDGICTTTELDTIVDERLDSAFQELGTMEIETNKLKGEVCDLQNQLNKERNKVDGTVKVLSLLVFGLIATLIYVKWW